MGWFWTLLGYFEPFWAILDQLLNVLTPLQRAFLDLIFAIFDHFWAFLWYLNPFWLSFGYFWFIFKEYLQQKEFKGDARLVYGIKFHYLEVFLKVQFLRNLYCYGNETMEWGDFSVLCVLRKVHYESIFQMKGHFVAHFLPILLQSRERVGNFFMTTINRDPEFSTK